MCQAMWRTWRREEWWGPRPCPQEMGLKRDKVFLAEQQARIENKNEQIHEKCSIF